MDKVSSSTVVKALRVLDSVLTLSQDTKAGVSVSELARHSGEHASSICKHLAAFEQFGLIQQDPQTERYAIGNYALRLADTVLKHLDLRQASKGTLQKLVDQSGETVHLVIRDGLRVVYIEKYESTKAIRMHSELAARNPLYCTGVGKVILAFSPPALLEAVIQEGLPRFTEHTLTTASDLQTDLALIRSRGYAIDLEEHENDVHCVAAPIYNHQGYVVGAISIAGPKWRMTLEQLTEFGHQVKSAAAVISQQIGYVKA